MNNTPRMIATRVREGDTNRCHMFYGCLGNGLSGRPEFWVADKTDWLWVCERCSIGRAAPRQIICCVHSDG